MVVRAPISVLLLLTIACRSERGETNDAPTPARAPDPAPVGLPADGPPPEPRMLPAPGEPRLDPEHELRAARLPNGPRFEGVDVPLGYDDGSYSVQGVRDGPEAYFDRELVIRGWVTHIYMPALGCVICPPAHVRIADGPERRGRRNTLMVVGFDVEIPPDEAAMWADEAKVLIEYGKQYRFRGKFVRDIEHDMVEEQGILQFIAYASDTDGSWIYPPGAAWHPKRQGL